MSAAHLIRQYYMSRVITLRGKLICYPISISDFHPSIEGHIDANDELVLVSGLKSLRLVPSGSIDDAEESRLKGKISSVS